MLDENVLFKTSDLPLASALRCMGAVVEAVDRQDPSRAVFNFRREKGLDGLVQAFWAHELKVDPIAYFAAIKELKAFLYSARST